MPPPASTTPSMPSAPPSGSNTLVDDASGYEREHDEQWLPRGEAVGRYVILERVGAGGMGVVYAAYDRDLDRRVAIKLLHTTRKPDHSKGQARLLREAQAMAKLAHPNVVAVHEAGTYQGRLFIAMEFIDGQTLGQWLDEAPRSWREVVEVMRQAGRGLAAAHQQELIHRDFKPDNILLGRDGRARVLDFGLARSLGETTREELFVDKELLSSRESAQIRLTETGALAGTPAYMAPEQYRGQAPDARTDQFSFCVTLWEALYGQRPFAGTNRAQLAMAVCRGEIREPPTRDAPTFLRRLMRRGLSVSRQERFESMDALLDALDRDPSRTRRRAMGVGLAVVGVASLAAMVARLGGGDDPCTAGAERLAAAWDDERRDAIDTAFSRVDAQFAATSLETVLHELDGYASGWLDGYRDACEATHVRHEQSSELLDRRMACLSERLGALSATTELLAQADRDAIAHSIRAATSLPAVEECARTDRLMARFAPPSDPARAQQVEQLRERLARARALGLTGQADVGLTEAQAAREEAGVLGHPPLTAEASMAVAELSSSAGHPQQALERLHATVDEAIAAGHDQVLTQAATRLVSVIGVSLSHYEEAERWGRLAAAAVRRRGEEPGDAIALARTMCMMRADKGDAAEALPHCQRALDLSIDRHGPEHAATGVAYRALGNAHYSAGDYAAAERAYERSTELFLDSHGVDHPEYPALLNSLAAVCYSQQRGAQCVELFEQTVHAAVRSYGPEHPAVADFTNNLAIVLQAEGRLDEAETHARRSLELRRAQFGDDHPGVGAAHRALARVAQARGDQPGALHHADRAVEILRATRGDAHPDVLDALRVRAAIHLEGERIDEGLLDWEAALTMAQALARPPLDLAEIRFALAQALATHRPDDRERALALATQAEADAAGQPLADQIAQWRAGQESPEPGPT